MKNMSRTDREHKKKKIFALNYYHPVNGKACRGSYAQPYTPYWDRITMSCLESMIHGLALEPFSRYPVAPDKANMKPKMASFMVGNETAEKRGRQIGLDQSPSLLKDSGRPYSTPEA
jgi:hypothetical protein